MQPEAPQGDERGVEAAVVAPEQSAPEMVEQPAKLLRIASMIRELLEDVRQTPIDEGGRQRLKGIYERSIAELADGLSGDLRDELARLSSPFSEDTPSDAELRVAQAQLVGWLEGLFHGIQAALWAQQVQARAALEEMRRRGLPSGMPHERPGRPQSDNRQTPGQYL